MDPDEREAIEPVGDHCEECGVKLTPQEIAIAMETGGPALCSVHAAEAEALPDDPADE